MIDEYRSIQTVEKVLNGESNFYVRGTEKFNKCVKHIYGLINDAYVLYSHEAFSSAVFLSIAIIEEVAKVHMGIFVKHSGTLVKKDKLKDHKTKEIIGVNYTISMGSRLQEAIGPVNLEEIYELAYSGKLKELREKSIYCEYTSGNIVTPNEIITKEFSRSILLFAIESFDDNLVGYTQYSMDISKKTDELFEKISNST